MNPPSELNRLVSGPPTLRYRSGQDPVLEAQVLVGWVAFNVSSLTPEEERRTLTDLGVCMEYARYYTESYRWERVLFSEAVADMLEAMLESGELELQFEAGPSVGEVKWLEMQAQGALERPELGLRDYLTPAGPEQLDRVKRATVLPSSLTSS